MTSKTIQAITAAAAAIFMLGALAAMSSAEAPQPARPALSATQTKPAAQKAARLAVLASPWQGMSDTELMAGVVLEPVENEMFAVFGKSLKHEQVRKLRPGVSPETSFEKDTGAYQISPDYSCIERAHEFIRLAAKSDGVKCLFIARLEPWIDKKGNVKKDKKTGKDKSRYKKFAEIPKIAEGE